MTGRGGEPARYNEDFGALLVEEMEAQLHLQFVGPKAQWLIVL